MEHFWKLLPVSILMGTTHTLVEVMHSSNRELRHRLNGDSEPGYYGYYWAIAIPDDEETPDDFDELYYLSSGDHYQGFLRTGKEFKESDFSLAVERSLNFVKAMMVICEAKECAEVE